MPKQKPGPDDRVLSIQSVKARLLEPEVFGMVLGLGKFDAEDLVQILAKDIKFKLEPTASMVGTALWGLAIEVVEAVILVHPRAEWTGKITSLWRNQLLTLPALQRDPPLLWAGEVTDKYKLVSLAKLQRTTLVLSYRK